MKEIDGSHGEGGGAILRVAAGLSVINQQAVRVFNIRSNRPQPGLKTQHLLGLRAAAEVCGGSLEGGALGSTEVVFTPGNSWKKKIKVQIPTAGAVGLVMQVLQLACLRAPHKIEVEFEGGASWGKWAPPLDYLCNVTYPTLRKMGYNIELSVERGGFYPKGGCAAMAIIKPCEKLENLDMETRGEITKISGISVASTSLKNAKVAERQKVAARGLLFKELGVSAEIKELYSDSVCPGSGVCLWAETDAGVILGAGCIGERWLRAEAVGEGAAKDLVSEVVSGDTVDRYVSDQIIPFMALSKPRSCVRVDTLTDHAATNIWVCDQMLGRSVSFSDGFLRKSE